MCKDSSDNFPQSSRTYQRYLEIYFRKNRFIAAKTFSKQCQFDKFAQILARVS